MSHSATDLYAGAGGSQRRSFFFTFPAIAHFLTQHALERFQAGFDRRKRFLLPADGTFTLSHLFFHTPGLFSRRLHLSRGDLAGRSRPRGLSSLQAPLHRIGMLDLNFSELLSRRSMRRRVCSSCTARLDSAFSARVVWTVTAISAWRACSLGHAGCPPAASPFACSSTSAHA